MENEKKITEVTIKELKNGRMPSQEEYELFEKEVKRDLKKKANVTKVYVFVGVLILACLIARLYLFGQMTPTEAILYGLIGLAAAGNTLLSIRLKLKIYHVSSMFQARAFVVWNAKIRDIKDEAGKWANVKIDADGQSCSEWFSVDTPSAREASKGLPHDFWLLVFPKKNKILWSKLVSDLQANGNGGSEDK